MSPVSLAGRDRPAERRGAVPRRARPDRPARAPRWSTARSPRTSTCAPARRPSGRPNRSRAQFASGQMARRYGLPWRSSNATASNVVDAQAAYESEMAVWGAVMGGVNLLYQGAGWLEGGLTASYEKLILDAEILQMMSEVLQPLVGRRGDPRLRRASPTSGRAATSSARPTRSSATRPRSTGRSSPTGATSRRGRRTARGRPRSGRTRSGSGCWPRPSRRRSTRPGRGARRRSSRGASGRSPTRAWTRPRAALEDLTRRAGVLCDLDVRTDRSEWATCCRGRITRRRWLRERMRPVPGRSFTVRIFRRRMVLHARSRPVT